MSATHTFEPQATALPSLFVNSKRQYGDWRDDFFKNGYYIFKQAIAPEKAQNYYYKKAIDWIPSFDNGFDLNNKDTWTSEYLPKKHQEHVRELLQCTREVCLGCANVSDAC